MPKSNTIRRSGTPSRRVTKDEASSELTQLLEQIDAMGREARALAGQPSELSNSAQGSVMRGEPDDYQDPRDEELERADQTEEGTPLEPDEDDMLAGQIAPPGRADGEDEEPVEPGDPQNPMKALRALKSQISRIERALIEGDPDSSTASGTAEERTEDIPEYDEENIDEIAKAIVSLAARKRQVRRSASTPYRGEQMADERDMALIAVSRSLRDVHKAIAAIKNPLNDILEGLGVTKALEEAQPVRRKTSPSLTRDQGLVAKELLNSLLAAAGGQVVEKENTDPQSQSETVRKNLGQFMGLFSQQAGDLWNQ